MRFMMELFDGVRIDHFRGLESYYSIPAGDTTARNGQWKKGPGMALIRALSPICRNALMIAEDLGDITPAVEKLVKDSRLRFCKPDARRRGRHRCDVSRTSPNGDIPR